MNFLLGKLIFRSYVSFREGIFSLALWHVMAVLLIQFIGIAPFLLSPWVASLLIYFGIQISLHRPRVNKHTHCLRGSSQTWCKCMIILCNCWGDFPYNSADNAAWCHTMTPCDAASKADDQTRVFRGLRCAARVDLNSHDFHIFRG